MGRSVSLPCRQMGSCVLIAMCLSAQVMDLQARPIPSSADELEHEGHLRGMKFQVQQPTILSYHNGPIMSGTTGICVYLIWYGNFTDAQRSIILDFFSSFDDTSIPHPSVASWWAITSGYKDTSGVGIQPTMSVKGQLNDYDCSKGKNLVTADLSDLVTGSLTTFPTNANSIYMILTADDVMVGDFCSSDCASHFATSPTSFTQNELLPYGWVGNPGLQCPGKCSWPFAQSEYGPYTVPLIAPNGDVGVDGMIINMASILAGIATNPYDSGFYQGDGAAPLEAATACPGDFGPGAYAGYAGQLLTDNSTGESFNAWGINYRKFLLPGLWDPITQNCTPPS